MINLQDVSALPIVFDDKDEKLVFGEDLLCESSEKISLKSLIPSLLNKSLVYPSDVYEEHRNMRMFYDEERVKLNVTYDLLYFPEGLLGVEFTKSHIYYSPNGSSPGTVSTIIEVLAGNITILLQKNLEKSDLDFETKTEDMIVIIAQTGEKVVLPKGYYYSFINAGEVPAIISRIYRNKGLIDYTEIKKEQGMAYFCIRKNARCEFVKNPRYREIRDIRNIRPHDTLEKTEVDMDRPLYSQVVGNVGIFVDMLWN